LANDWIYHSISYKVIWQTALAVLAPRHSPIIEKSLTLAVRGAIGNWSSDVT
jgi:hypothetical protein